MARNPSGTMVQCAKGLYAHERASSTSDLTKNHDKIVVESQMEVNNNLLRLPVFTICITGMQVACYAVSVYAPHVLGIYGRQPWPHESFLMFDPYKRRQVWRFATGMFHHDSAKHLMANCVGQLVFGIPLEMSSEEAGGRLRIACVYITGEVFASLGCSALWPRGAGLGASSGLSALASASLVSLALDWMQNGSRPAGNRSVCVWKASVVLVCCCSEVIIPIASTLWNACFAGDLAILDPSVVSHFLGYGSGLLTGVILLEEKRVSKSFRRKCAGTLALMVGVLVGWQLVGTVTGWFPEEEYTVIPKVSVS